MATAKVFSLNNEPVGEVELADAVFNAPINRHLIWEAVNHYLACGRAGTASTKNRGAVTGSGRKLWRQKGTGRARTGDIKNPKWRGGGTVHGPQPRDFSFTFPRKKRRGALRSALSAKLSEGHLRVVENWNLESLKTRGFVGVLTSLGVQKRVLVMDDDSNENLILASRNVPSAKFVSPLSVNIHDLLKYDELIVSSQAVQKLQEVLSQ